MALADDKYTIPAVPCIGNEPDGVWLIGKQAMNEMCSLQTTRLGRILNARPAQRRNSGAIAREVVLLK